MDMPAFSIEGDLGESRRNHRKGAGENPVAQQEESQERRSRGELGQAEHRARLSGHGRHDVEIALDPQRNQADGGEECQGEWHLLWQHTEQAEEGNDEHAEEHPAADRPPGTPEAGEKETGLLGKISIPDHQELSPHQIGPEYGETEAELSEVVPLFGRDESSYS